MRTNGVTANIRNIDLLGLPFFNINDREEIEELFYRYPIIREAAEFSIIIIMKQWSYSCKIKVFFFICKNAISHIWRPYTQILFLHFCEWQPLNAIVATWQDYFYYIKGKKGIKMNLFKGVICQIFFPYQGTYRTALNLNTEIWPHIWIS